MVWRHFQIVFLHFQTVFAVRLQDLRPSVISEKRRKRWTA
jgi:hypothetical protein